VSTGADSRIGERLGIKETAVVKIAFRRLAERELTGTLPEIDSVARQGKSNPKKPRRRPRKGI
jgi:hypothetical protein